MASSSLITTLHPSPTPHQQQQADNCLNGECSIDDVNDLLIQLRVQVKNLKSQVGELEKYEQQLTQMNGTPAARDALKDIIKVRTSKKGEMR